METAWILLLAFWMYWVLIREKPIYLDGPSVGFWASCLGNFRTQGLVGQLQPELNAVAAQYVASVYGMQDIGRMRRRIMAFTLGIGGLMTFFYFGSLVVFGLTHIMLPEPVITVSLVGSVVLTASFFALRTTYKREMKKSGIQTNKKKRALIEIGRIRQSPLGPAIDAAVFEVHPPSIWWWPYPQGRGRFFRNRLKLLAVCLPVAWAIMYFIQTHVACYPSFKEHNLVIFILLLLAMAVEWMLFVSALVMWGDWQGGSKSSWETFPLYILIKDIADLTC